MKKIIEGIRNHPRRRLMYIFCYSAVFTVCALLAMIYFIIKSKSFIWVGGNGNMDGISQHYIALGYWGQYLRDIVSGIFSGDFSIPLFDSSIGFGGDIIQTLSYYVLGDPLNLFSIFVPLKYTEYLYAVLIIVRMYLAGLAFSALALHFKKGTRLSVIIGSMVYVFSAYGVFAAVRHPYFTNPMIYLPLILLGSEYILEGKKPWLFVLSVALAGLSNFYFFYMICILTVIYVFVRVFHFAPKGERKKILVYLRKFILWAVLGVIMSCVLFYPSIRTTLGSSRLSSDGSGLPLLYGLEYYSAFFGFFNTANNSTFWLYHGTLPITLAAVFLMWCAPKKNKTQIIFFSLGTLFLLFPIFGYLLNGVAYVANRWVWAYALILAMITAFQLPELKNITKKRSVILGIIYLIFALIGILAAGKVGGAVTSAVTMMITATVIIIIGFGIKTSLLMLRASILTLTLIQVANFGYTRYIGEGYVNEFENRSTALDNIRNAPSAFLYEYDTDGFYRYEDHFDSSVTKQRNAALLNGGNPTDIYFSLSSEKWYEMLRSTGDKSALVQKTEGIDNKTILGALANIRYYTVDTENAESTVPYGYSGIPIHSAQLKNHAYFRTNSGTDRSLVTFDTYYNENALPFGYTYDSYITRSEYDSLSMTDRQNALLYNAVLEENSELLKKGSISESAPLDIEIRYDSSISAGEGSYYTNGDGGYVYITVKNAQPECETYINFLNIAYSSPDPKQSALLNGSWDSLSTSDRLMRNFETLSYVQPNMKNIDITCGELTKTLQLYSSDYSYYMGPLDFSINLGYRAEAPTEIKLWIPAKSLISFDSIEVTQIGFEGYSEQIAELSSEHLENVVFEGNRLTGNITVSENKLLCLSLPYSPGWTAYVDGEKAELLQTDIGFMGLELASGSHEIELRYFTPYLSFGIMLSCIGCISFAAIYFYDKTKSKRKRETV